MKLANYEMTELESRIDKALTWWCGDEVTNEYGAPPADEVWDKLISGLEQLNGDGAPESIRTALVVARDRSVRCWGMIAMCLETALDGKVNP